MDKDIKKNKPKASSKRVKNTETIKKYNFSILKLMVINDEDKFEIVEVPAKLKWEYINRFGLLTVTTKHELITWLNLQNV